MCRLCVYFWAATSLLFSVFTFGAFAVSGKQLTPQIAFTSLALFNVLIGPLNSFPWVVNGIVEALVSLGRLEGFLRSPEVPERSLADPAHLGSVPVKEGSRSGQRTPRRELERILSSRAASTSAAAEAAFAVTAQVATFAWTSSDTVERDDGAFLLRDIHLRRVPARAHTITRPLLLTIQAVPLLRQDPTGGLVRRIRGNRQRQVIAAGRAGRGDVAARGCASAASNCTARYGAPPRGLRGRERVIDAAARRLGGLSQIPTQLDYLGSPAGHRGTYPHDPGLPGRGVCWTAEQ